MAPQSIETVEEVGGLDDEGFDEGASVGCLVGWVVGLGEGASVSSTHNTPFPVKPGLQVHVYCPGVLEQVALT